MDDMNRGHAPKLALLSIFTLIAACSSEAAAPAASAPGGGLPPVAGSPVLVPPTAAGAGTAAPSPTAPPVTPPPQAAAGTGAITPAQPDAPPPGATPTTPPGGTAAGSDMWCGVKRTLDTRCNACHNEQKVAGAPMSLKTYADLTAPAYSDPSKKVFQVVGTRVHDTARPMPPQEQLTPDQLNGIDTWVAAGAPVGADPTCAANGAPPAPTEQAWPDNCDATYKILAASDSQPNSIAPGAETHPQVPVTAPWGREEVQAIAWRAITDNPKVLHHWILYGPAREFLFGWAPGKDINEPLPPDVGVYLPSGNMTLDVHYNNLVGTAAEKDASGVEICVLKKQNFRPKTATVANRLTQVLINVPARATNQEVTGTCNHTGEQVRLLSVSPHAHKAAKHMKFTVEKASGETIVMHDAPFNFEEQTTYALNPPIVIESGDRIITTCTFTNDTSRTITFGENTGNEMCFNFALYEPMGALNCGAGIGGFPTF